MANRRCNLLAKDCDRAMLGNELEPRRPQVAGVVGSFTFPRRAEGLARAGAGPDGAVVGPSGLTEGVTPDADSGEEVALGESSEVVGSNIDN